MSLPPPKEITIKFEAKTLEKLVETGNLLMPELQSTRVHMDSSVVEFLTLLQKQYSLEKLMLTPEGMRSNDLQDYYIRDLIIKTQLELIQYLLDVNNFNRTANK